MLGKIKIDHSKIKQEGPKKQNKTLGASSFFPHSPLPQDQTTTTTTTTYSSSSSPFPLSLTAGEAHVLGTGLLPHTAGTKRSSKYR